MIAASLVREADVAADLRRSAVHEAGHAVVAEALTGAPARVEIERHTDGRAVWHRGRCTHVQGATVQEQQLIGLAGPVAEVLDSPHRGSTGDVLARAILGRMSTTDTQAAGVFGRADLDRALQVVWRLWPSVEARAQREIARFHETQQRRRGGALLTT